MDRIGSLAREEQIKQRDGDVKTGDNRAINREKMVF